MALISGGGGGGASLGVWKTYGVDSGNAPLSGVTVGNGLLVGRWWTPAAVSAQLATPSFLCVVDLEFNLGSTSSVGGPITCDLPTLVDGTSFDLFQRDNGRLVVTAVALVNNTQFLGFATDKGSVFRSAAGVPWDATHPDVWDETAQMHATVTFQAIFVGD